MKHLVLCQNWTEFERGWGNRPDGFTYHLTQKHRDDYVKQYNEKYNAESYVPDEYSTATGNPYLVIVDDNLFKLIKDHDGNMWGEGNHGPSPATNEEVLELSNQTVRNKK